MKTLLEIKQLTLGYDHHDVIKNLSFNIHDGDFICLVGANGSGKSTLAKGILGLLPPRHGKIIFHNLKQTNVGYIPQEHKIDHLFPASVEEIVMSGFLNQLGWRPFYTKNKHQIAHQNLKLLHIESLAEQNFSELSGGQRQKVLLARALCATSKLLILDEPSNNLDYQSKRELYQLVQRLNHDQHITILMITHDLDHRNLIGDKILALSGEKYFFGSTQQYVKTIHKEAHHA